jgi:diadenosine tetraphosphate (Ap4A) HIT family hydrolase
MDATCELCTQAGGDVLVQTPQWRIVLVSDQQKAFPGYCRVIWQQHVAEMTDLAPAQRTEFMNVVWQVENCIRQTLQPDKINLASLGNFTPHLHWHVIPRWRDDSHFPHAIWANPQRAGLTEHSLNSALHDATHNTFNHLTR